MPRDKSIRRVLMIGSGPIVIGQAAEFDYSGTQACRALREDRIEIILLNSNPATIMTDTAIADKVYIEPLTLETVERIIEVEKPDGILSGLGGQTALTLCMKLARAGFLEKHGVRLLGASPETIDKAEDRELFKETMESIGQPCAKSTVVYTVDEALDFAREIGYPVIVRPAYTLGGTGGGIATDEASLRAIAESGIGQSPIGQILIERCVAGWKEIEFEVMRDCVGNVITICSMENVDPVGIHTGDSIVVAPALTLSDKEYQMLRTAALDIISALGVTGGCNVQFALNPDSFEYVVIEVNPRVSRSSALASKATGYPIAKVSTKLALGYTLDEIKNSVTGTTYAAFEPALDYVAVKMPKWPFDKFPGSSRTLGTQMKATGEVMTLADNFEAALIKAIRGAEIGADTLLLPRFREWGESDLWDITENATDERIFAIAELLRRGVAIDDIYKVSKIDKWFLAKIKNLVEYEISVTGVEITPDVYLRGKKLGYADSSLQRMSGSPLPPHIAPVYRMVDTCAGEFAAETPYFYAAYSTPEEGGEDESSEFIKKDAKTILVIGSGPIRIGQGIEFDYSSVHCVWALKRQGYDVVIVNNNPETVSTDFDTADRLYFEPPRLDDVMDIVRHEKPIGVVVAFGGQTAIRLVKGLHAAGVPILGTSADAIDIAEDRERFDKLLEKFNISRPKGCTVKTLDEALLAANMLGYPVLLRPSYVIGGQGMTIARSDVDTRSYMSAILAGGIENPVLIDKYMPGAELEVDVISDSEDILIPGIMEHIERAGIHSGDSIAVYPPYNLSERMEKKICEVSKKLAVALGTKGLVNIQYLVYSDELYVIEVNPRASRTIPYISKVTGVPMVDIAARVMVGERLRDIGYGTGLWRAPYCYAVKVPVFSFEKLTDADSILGPEMKSTGEVLGIGRTKTEALYKGLVASGLDVCSPADRREIGVLISVEDYDHKDAIALAEKFCDIGVRLYGTPDTAAAIRSHGIDIQTARDVWENNDIYDLVESKTINYIVYTGGVMDISVGDYRKLRHRAMQLGIPCMTSLDTASALADIIASHYNQYNTKLFDISTLSSTK